MTRFFPFLLSGLLAVSAWAQPAKHEFRGAWVASVANLDWPSTPHLSTAQQQAELIVILDRLKADGINAVVFQVRTESDALYDSPFEPWSYWLTGSQGTAPSPLYDPLAFAVQEAHERGMELHAWINPYRADRGSFYPKAASHVTNAQPEWILSFSTGVKILDPGLPEVRDHVTSIVGDIARRYAIDGIHYDDYFYPYPSGNFSGMTTEDDATFAAHSRGFTNRGDWRRDNVNLLVAQIQDTLQAVRPEAVHGVSPFGIWKNGVPTGITGLDAYNVIYADAVAWLHAQDVDYLAPQLYWSSQRTIGTSFNRQRFTTLASWWASVRNERHIYTGLAAYRIGGPGFEADEIPTQIRYTRSQEGLDGTILFRPYAGLFAGGLGLEDSLKTDLYRHPALSPVMMWKSQEAPDAPEALVATERAENTTVDIAWTAPASGTTAARFYAVYRVPSAEAGDLGAALGKAENLIAVTGETSVTDTPPVNDLYTYVATSVSANSIESAPSNAVTVQSSVASEPATRLAFSLDAPRPNPTHGDVTLAFTLRQPANVTLRVVDVLGREVVRLLDNQPLSADGHRVVWTPASASAGTYVVVIEAGGERATRPLTVLR